LSVLEVSGLNQVYGESQCLWDVDLTVPAGVCTCLLGRNGVGKTSLLKAIMGLLRLRSGTVRIEGEDLTDLPAERRAPLGIAYVPQGREVFPLLTVEENLLTGLRARADKAKTLPTEIFDIFPVLKQMLQRRGGDLSGGQQQQLAIARALVIKPRLLILDEPTEGIQPNLVHEIGDVIGRLKREFGMTVLLVEQKLPFARRVADQFYVMEKGRVVAYGVMADLTPDIVQRHLSV
jgi:urea transport system ATP-binding protein